MERRNLLARAGLIALCVLFFGGLARLNRISLTSSYPSFSSLRSDGGGTKLLWEGLAGTGKVSEQRSYRPLEETRFTGCSVFYLGLRPVDLAFTNEEFLQTAERVAQNGNRLILGITDDPIDKNEKSKKDPLLVKRWNIRFTQIKAKGGEDASVSVNADTPWQPVSAGKSPVALERTFGLGTVVILPHVSRLSNAALAKDQYSRAMVPALVGNNGTVVFDEAHLGVVESGSIAGLARKYRLHGLLAGLLLLAASFLWNRSVAFPPMEEADRKDGIEPVAGNDTRSTLVNLLSRHIAPEDLLKICIAEWNRISPDQKIEKDHKADLKDPVLIYRSIQEDLQGEKKLRL